MEGWKISWEMFFNLEFLGLHIVKIKFILECFIKWNKFYGEELKVRKRLIFNIFLIGSTLYFKLVLLDSFYFKQKFILIIQIIINKFQRFLYIFSFNRRSFNHVRKHHAISKT
jgi:hypothetical protein